MAMAVSNYLAVALLNEVFRNTAYTQPTVVYVALYTSNPTAADSGTEVSGGSYSRQSVTFSAPVVDSGKQTIRNNAEVVFPIATADWGAITHVGIRDASTTGNLLYYGALTNQRTVLSGDRIRIQTDSLALTLN
jgi:hypothetical protein